MRTVTRRAVPALIALAALLVAAHFLAGAASGHALPQTSTPANGSTLSIPPTSVTITFGETPDPALSSIHVLDSSGRTVSTGAATPAAGVPLTLTVPLGTLGPGVYTVAWRTVSVVDGHTAAGSFAFGVGTVPPPAASGGTGVPATGSTDAGMPSPVAIVGRWLLFVGLLVLVGGAGFGLLVTPPAALLRTRLLPAAWLVAMAGSLIVVAVQVADAGVGLSAAFASSLGSSIIERIVPLLFAGFGVAAVARRAGDRSGLGVAGFGAVVALGVDVLLSHAAAGSGATVSLIVQVLHVFAVGLWLGGLAGLLVTLRHPANETTARAARRFSRLATAGIGVVAVTGVLRGIAEVGTLDLLVSTAFGRLLIAKTVLLGVLALLGAVNHFRHVPAAGRTIGGLRRVGSAELLVGATILLLSATLVNLAPPVETAAATRPGATPAGTPSPPPGPTPAPLVATGSDFGTSVKLRLVVTPGVVGVNTFTATVTDYDTGAPVPATGVALRFTPPRADVGTSRLDLAPTAPAAPGTFAVTGTNLSLEGAWHVVATVANAASSVEVPLDLTVQSATATPPAPGPTIDVNAVAGLPTIYTVHLPAGRAVQVYADPGTSGANLVHLTFFDAAGQELPVPSVALVIGPAGGAGATLPSTEVEPGHFVASATLEPGTYHLTISGTAPGGDLLETGLDLTSTK